MKPFRERNITVLGVVSLITLVVVLVATLELTKLPFGTHLDYHADLTTAGQLAPGENVEIAGVKVGTVRGISLVNTRKGTHVQLDFQLDHHLQLGNRTTLTVKVLSVLGQEYVQLTPAGVGSMPAGSTIPLTRTFGTGTLAGTLNQLGETSGPINEAQLQQSLQVINTDLSAVAPTATAQLISGLGRLSNIVTGREAQLSELVTDAESVTATINTHKVQLLNLIGQSNLILQVIEQRQADLQNLLGTTTTLASRISDLITSKNANLGQFLAELRQVSATLAQSSANLGRLMPLAAAAAKYGANATGNGPFVDAESPTLFINDSLIQGCKLPGAFKPGLDGTSCNLKENDRP